MDPKTILAKLDRIDDLPTLPAIAMEVNKMLQDYDTSIKKLSDRIEKDQAMVFKILKLVNSAFFGLRSKVSNIPNAVILLGFNTVRNAIVTVSILDAFSVEDVSKGFDITDFWKHSVAVAVTSRYIAERTKLHIPDDCFIGGLLHDIGKIILAQYFQDSFKKIYKSTQENNLTFYDAEKNEFPVNHAQIGGHLAKKWQLPAGLVDSIRYHHDVRKSANDLNLLMIIHVADIIVNGYRSDSNGGPDLSEIYPDAMKAMKSQLDTLPDWYPEVSMEIDAACSFFLKESMK